MGEGLLRQRRNLLISCIFLWFMKYGAVSVPGLKIVGIDIKINNPDALIVAAWIAFAYFLYRYYQYFAIEGVPKLKSIFNILLEEKCSLIMRRLVEAKYPLDLAPGSRQYIYASLKNSGWIYKGQTYNKDGNPENFELPIAHWKLWKGILAANMDYAFRNSVLTDYILPFFLAGYVLYYCGTNDWNGSFIRLLIN